MCRFRAAHGHCGEESANPGCRVRQFRKNRNRMRHKRFTDVDNDANHLDDGSIGSSEFFTDTDMTMYWANPAGKEAQAKLQKKLKKKGDLVSYKGHVSTIYSDKPSCDNNSCTYQIIHAYGENYADNRLNKDIFSRKVIVTDNDLPSSEGGILVPNGFGRIKLWD